MASDTPNKTPPESRSWLKSLYKDPQYSDLIIKSGNQEFHVHRNIVCTQSGFFKKACQGDWQESKSGVIKLYDDPTEVIAQMIQFLYLSTYEDAPFSRPESPFGAISFNLKMFMAADKYDISALVGLAKIKFKTRMSQLGDSEDFISTVRELYKDELDITKEMRQSAVEAAASHANTLFKQDSKNRERHQQADPFRKLISEIPSFGAEVMAGLATKLDKREQSFENCAECRCRTCAITFGVPNTQCHKTVYCPLCMRKAIRL